MKKQMSLFIWAVAVFGMSPVFGATNTGMRGSSVAELTSGPAVRSNKSVNYKKYETRTSTKTYESKDGKNLYYSQPSKRSDLYKAYDNGTGATTSTSVRTSRFETTRSVAKRKYYLAHPFFQPLKGKFGSVTDLAYTTNSYDFSLGFDFDVADEALGLGGKWDLAQFSIKEDFSYGITDEIALMATAQFNITDYKFKWNDGTPDDKSDNTDLGVIGLGGQWRFLDDSEWIATASVYFQHQKDMFNAGILELKGGYKYGQSTIYGLGRAWYVNFDGDVYGNGVTDGDTSLLIAYSDNTSTFYGEGGIGVFSVLDEDWTLNVEGVFGYYDWRSQATVKAAIGWQPNDWGALNLYAKTSVYDSANDKKLEWYLATPETYGYEKVGMAQIDKSRETTFGLQGILYF